METTAFKQLFGESPAVRAIDFFLDNQEFDYSMADVVREEGMSYNTLKPVWDELVRLQMIIPVGKLGKGVRYAINKTNPAIKALNTLDRALVASDPAMAHYFLKKQRVKA
jgi:hypothetical protein